MHAILDAGLICHVGFALDGRPWVFPTAYGRLDDRLYLHGASANFALRTLASGVETSVAVTIVDGLVLSRSAFHHSMNYRSVMLFGRAEEVCQATEKRRALAAIVDHVVPGRAADSRAPSDQELRKSLVVRIPIEEASAKVRSGGPLEEQEDLGLHYWAGQVPLVTSLADPVPDEVTIARDAQLPPYLEGWAERRRVRPSA